MPSFFIYVTYALFIHPYYQHNKKGQISFFDKQNKKGPLTEHKTFSTLNQYFPNTNLVLKADDSNPIEYFL